MADTIRVVPTIDGPYMVTGNIELLWPSGHAISTAGEADEAGALYFCRCGASNNKPFCDSSHKRIGFKSREGDATAHKD
ncbi:MAG: CDGSH iron-sulfur domain-containing protein [Candidatus Baltobacteraceae bacterium]